MRDRLEELRQRAQEALESGSVDDSNPFPGGNDPDDPVEVNISMPQAVVFEEEPVVENFLSEAQRIRDEITELDVEVSYIYFYSVAILHSL